MAAPPFSAAEPRRSASPSPSTATTQPRQESMASSVFATRVAERGPAPPQVWENTYKLRDPDAPSSFNKSAVAAIIQSKLSSRLEKMEYDPATAAGVRCKGRAVALPPYDRARARWPTNCRRASKTRSKPADLGGTSSSFTSRSANAADSQCGWAAAVYGTRGRTTS